MLTCCSRPKGPRSHQRPPKRPRGQHRPYTTCTKRLTKHGVGRCWWLLALKGGNIWAIPKSEFLSRILLLAVPRHPWAHVLSPTPLGTNEPLARPPKPLGTPVFRRGHKCAFLPSTNTCPSASDHSSSSHILWPTLPPLSQSIGRVITPLAQMMSTCSLVGELFSSRCAGSC